MSGLKEPRSAAIIMNENRTVWYQIRNKRFFALCRADVVATPSSPQTVRTSTRIEAVDSTTPLTGGTTPVSSAEFLRTLILLFARMLLFVRITHLVAAAGAWFKLLCGGKSFQELYKPFGFMLLTTTCIITMSVRGECGFSSLVKVKKREKLRRLLLR